MVAKFTETVILRDPSSQATVAFFDGDEVPEWAEVGDHVTDAGTKVQAKRPAPSKTEK